VGETKHLIVNADDFGFSAGINRGIVEAYEHGIVTSASLMVDQPGAEEAAAYAREHPKLGVGVHLELPGWRAATRALHRAIGSETRLAEAVTKEVGRQLDRFRTLVGRDATHVDSHRHRHRHEPARSVVAEVAGELGVPARDLGTTVRHCRDFYGQTYGRIYSTRPNLEAISVDALVRLLEELSPGVSELCCHPGYADDLEPPFRKEPYRGERVQEVRALCDRRVRATVERQGIRLCSFRDLPALRAERPEPA
jgi:predicted glycoside hydrolase/deacetylase ChbG (UPF0249 family)